MSIRSRSVLVTGGAGFIGSHLVDRLISEGAGKVVVVDNFFLGNEHNLDAAKAARPDLEVVRLDASNLSAMQDVVAKHQVETVFDLATIPLPTSLSYPHFTMQTNIGITSAFCEIARRGSIERLVHMSSSEAYGSGRYVPMDEEHPHDALTPYAAAKSAEDHILRSFVSTFGIDATIIRPFNNYGPRQNPGSYAGIIPIIVKRVRAGEPILIHGDGEQSRDFTFVRDTVDFAVAIHDDPACRGLELNVATGVGTSINTLVSRMLEIMGKPNHPVEHIAERPGDVRRHMADVTKLKTIIGRQPEVLNADALAETIDWYERTL
ncbi:dTDP-glucose 4,6-dehydratase [Leucobacter tardus]|uniref:NAD-dependent epimerase/dehydratase family protein n=1 Tax=Leucobacter tardus TaxID=501483 RepID=A0A939TLH0_9MICO|nr:NAD-dependent epimerase/dehydratase family protein [Leucobacter tardus]MBO2988393.1 NAD-dependent epimerase/dehydratase family protein [Leucobacter tardus]